MLLKNKAIKTTINIPIMGKRIMEIEIPNEIRSSIIEIIGLINPPVNIEDNPLKLTVDNWNPPVIKTPLIIDNIDFTPGSISLREMADKVVPAIMAVGVANTSNKLSSHGTKFPIISNSAASTRTAITQSLPTQFQSSPNWTKPALYSNPYVNGGIKILKPQAADKPKARKIELINE